MKLSELIKECRKAKKELGDIPVIILTDTPDGLFHIQEDIKAEVIQIPKDEYEKEFEPPVFAIQWGDMFEEEKDNHPNLKVVK
jgi:uncharacterized protein YigE (DUF2233 family)